MTFQPSNHAQHDLSVVLLKHERMAVALDASLGEYIDGDVAAGGLEGFLERPRGHDAVLCTVADHDEDRHACECSKLVARNPVEGIDRGLDRKDALDQLGALGCG